MADCDLCTKPIEGVRPRWTFVLDRDNKTGVTRNVGYFHPSCWEIVKTALPYLLAITQALK